MLKPFSVLTHQKPMRLVFTHGYDALNAVVCDDFELCARHKLSSRSCPPLTGMWLTMEPEIDGDTPPPSLETIPGPKKRDGRQSDRIRVPPRPVGAAGVRTILPAGKLQPR